MIEPGICALLGPNGAGKSTLLRILSGSEHPDQGTVSICGMEFRTHGTRIRKSLGVMPEGLGLFESLSVIENLLAIGPIYGLSRQETETRAHNLLAMLDLLPGRHTLARSCSYGMRKKTALAMALLYRPDILLLDEPFEGIDPSSSVIIRSMLRQLADNGVTILLTSHILPVIQSLADRVLILSDGQIASDFNPVERISETETIYFSSVGTPEWEVPEWLRS